MNATLSHCLVAVACLLIAGPAAADWEADQGDKRQVKAATAIEKFRSSVPRTEQYFEDAYAFAILPSVTRFAVGFGGAYGSGIVIEGDEFIGTTRFYQFSSGIQGGVNNFSMIVFFRDKEALEYYQTGEIQFMGQAGVSVATVGVAGTPAYNDGVAIVTVTRVGLMFEFSYAGGKFTFKPLEAE